MTQNKLFALIKEYKRIKKLGWNEKEQSQRQQTLYCLQSEILKDLLLN